MAIRGRKAKTRTLGVLSLIGNAQEFLDRNDKPICERCGNKKKMKRLLVLTQLGMIADRTTVVFHCPQCLENTSYTYSLEFEISELGQSN